MIDGWEIKKISDVCIVISGQSPESKYYNKDGEGLPFYQGKKEFTKKTIGKPKTWTTKVTKEAFEGDILMSVRAPVGPVNLCQQHSCIGRGLAAIRSSDKIDNDYLFNFLVKYESEIVGNSGAVFNSINKTQISNIEIPVPPIEEQKEIVEILDKTFESIKKAKANIQKNIENANELFQSKLNQIFSQTGDDWENNALIDFCKFIDYRGKTPKKTQRGIKLITAKNVRMGYLRDNPQEFIDLNYYDKWMTRGIPKKGDVLFTTEAPLANVTLLNTSEKIALAQRIITLCPDRSLVIGEFLCYCLQSKIVQDKIIDNGSGATVTGIKSKLLKKIKVPITHLKKQKEIVETLDILYNHIQSLLASYEEELENLEDLKKSILQKAFSGELTNKNKAA